MPAKNLICVVVDRLHSGMVGAYGNSWIHTGQFDRLASESFLFDQALIDSPQLDQLYRSFWLGLHTAAQTARAASGSSFPHLVRAGGWHTALITDEREVTQYPLAGDFAEHVFVQPQGEDQIAEEISQTQLGELFGAATQWLQTPRQPFCLWLHARAMAGAWDAPWEFRNQYADEEDPQPPDFASVPNLWLSDKYDPDELLGVTHAYAGQVTLLDVCLGALLDQLQQTRLDGNTLLTLISARGFPLGEHRRIGACDEALYNETVQIPWLMRFPDGSGKLARSQALVQPADLPGTLLHWLDLDRSQFGTPHAGSLLGIIRGDVEAIRDRARMVSRHEQALQTPAWLLRQPVTGAAELYAKPSDRWEVNEVANRLPDVVAGLQAALTEIERTGGENRLPPLAETLV
ncbi:MAG: sulfatase-like hydrolase/transferase, partial [Planctomycetia bacterium]|nr:sulfatase-like hydrolase/transferase [Planctomycetia bacterium]